MTVASETNRAGPYIGNGVTTIFDYTFKILDEAHIRVIREENGIESTLVLNTDYIVSGVGASGGGHIACSVAPTASQTITILLDVPFTQEIDLENQGAFNAETIENGFDLAVMRDQQLAEKLDRALVIPASSSSGNLDTLIEAVVLLANNFDTVSVVANIAPQVEAVALIDDAVVIVAAHINNVDTVAGDIANIDAVAAIHAAISNVAGNSANVTTVAGKSADITTVAGIAANVTTVAGKAADVTTVAGKAAEVTTVAGSIAGVNAVAGNIANVNLVAPKVAQINTVASNIASVTNFADVYQGPKNANPALRNNGNALSKGDLFFDTVLNAMKAFNGVSWNVIDQGRERLVGDRTYYVRSDGNNGNTGLANTAGGAFLTLQYAYDFISRNLDFNGFTVTIQCGTVTTWTTGLNINNAWVGGGKLIFDGGGGTINQTNFDAIAVTSMVPPGPVTIQNVTVRTTTFGIGIHGNVSQCLIYIGAGVVFGPCATAHMGVGYAGIIYCLNNYTINGGAQYHYLVDSHATLNAAGITITLTGTPVFSIFAFTATFGYLYSTGSTFSGAATGFRYGAYTKSLIACGGSATFYPGNQAGAADATASYV